MKIYVFLALVLCAYAADVKETEKAAETETTKDKRQTQDEFVPSHPIQYRVARKQEQVAPVEELQEDDKPLSRSDGEQYRRGQVFSLNTQELLELQPERKAPLASNQLLQQLYNSPQPDHKQNLQQIYYIEPQGGRQVAFPSHAVIARPDYTSNGGEASVGAALSVSDTGSGNRDVYNQELLALLGNPSVRQEETRQQLYSQPQQVQHAQPIQQASTVQTIAPQYQQVDRYISKPSKKSKLRNKSQITPPQPSAAPQQYLIETTNVQQQQQAKQQSQMYRQAVQPQRVPQALRYVTVPQNSQVSQQILYERPESQGLKIVPAPKLQQQQPRAQLNYRLVPQYQPEAQPKQYRIVEAPRQTIRAQEQRLQSQSVERPITYLKRFPDHEKMRSVKIYDPIANEGLPPQPAQIIGDQQYYLRPLYNGNEQRARFDLAPQYKPEQRVETAKAPQSSIFVSKNLAPRKPIRPQPLLQNREAMQPHYEQVNLEQHGQSLEEQRAQLPPPKNNKAYTPEEFAALVAAGYSVTPVPVSSVNLHDAQSRSSLESVTMHPKRLLRPISSRRHQYLPLRGDDAP